MDGQKVQIILGNPAHGSLDRGADVKELHVQKDALAVFLLQLIGEREAAAGQHAKPDFVKADGIPQPGGKVEPLHHVRDIKGNDQAVIGHGGLWRNFGGFGRKILACQATGHNPLKSQKTPVWDASGLRLASVGHPSRQRGARAGLTGGACGASLVG